ncbi:hypothetical protein [Escherichia coli]|uniref:hypothetical protein n=1 Tax=Escherichia coli TaxID=562 RepID=UPI000E1BC025|nr:hypothetical protein [Escherichia coli]
MTVLHDLNQASRYCDHLVVLASGRVMAQGAPEAVMKPELLKTVFRRKKRKSIPNRYLADPCVW